MTIEQPSPSSSPHEVWPALPLDAWRPTYHTLHMWTQIIGKIRMALTPRINHWWNVPLYLTVRGLTTSPIPYQTHSFEIAFDFIEHQLAITTDQGEIRTLALTARPVAEFYREVMAGLNDLGIEVKIWTMPVEVQAAISFEHDTEHTAYDPGYVQRWWRILLQSDRVMKEFRAKFLGKSSPVHFFWGSFDLAVTRFSGQEAPKHPSGAPNVADWVMHEAYSHEVCSAGFWPGEGLGEPAYYSYAYPEPTGFRRFPVQPVEAYYHEQLREFILPYQAVRTATDPDQTLMAFLQTTYEAAAEQGGWNRAKLER